MSVINIGLRFFGRILFGLIQMLLVLIIVVLDITTVFGLEKAKLCHRFKNFDIWIISVTANPQSHDMV